MDGEYDIGNSCVMGVVGQEIKTYPRTRDDDTTWQQMILQGLSGPKKGNGVDAARP